MCRGDGALAPARADGADGAVSGDRRRYGLVDVEHGMAPEDRARVGEGFVTPVADAVARRADAAKRQRVDGVPMFQ